ncbi:MAG: CHAT domain-containing protein [Pyrinomonadaceae bacterium MAG19_C2-C3]|nr:CHAT domain-containing protein [Pyrinomonadaceae bacterium MAG19_C2-C3]
MKRNHVSRFCVWWFVICGMWFSTSLAAGQTSSPVAIKRAAELEKRADRLWAAVKLPEAINVTKQALRVREQAQGRFHLDVAATLNILGVRHFTNGQLAPAAACFARSLAIRQRRLDDNHELIAQSLANLGGALRDSGDYPRAEPLLKRALEIREKNESADSLAVANSLDNLGGLYHLKGDYAQAENLMRRALKIYQASLERCDPQIALSLSVIAGVLIDRRAFSDAAAALEQARDTLQCATEADLTSIINVNDTLARLYLEQNDYVRAEPLFAESLEVTEDALGKEHKDVGLALNNLASLYFLKGDYEKAMPLHLRALAIFEQALGARHPLTCLSRNNLAQTYDARGDYTRTAELLTRDYEYRERNLELVLGGDSEQQKLRYLRALSDGAELSTGADYVVSLDARAGQQHPTLTELAMTTVLARKGRVLDATAGESGVLRRRADADTQAILNKLKNTRTALAAFVFDGSDASNSADYRAQVVKLETELETLEAEASRRSVSFRRQNEILNLAQVRAKLPPGAVLVELILYRPFILKPAKRSENFGAPRYAAYILSKDDAPRRVELGDAAAIDKRATDFRRALSEQSDDVKQVARLLDDAIMKPVRRFIGDARTIFIAPDAALNAIPFAALVDEQGRYLVENYAFNYLSSGRDLLRDEKFAARHQPPLIIADPQFNSAAKNSSGKTSPPKTFLSTASPSKAISNMPRYRRLYGTIEEGAALARLLPDAKLLTREFATEANVKRTRAPIILHIATHGFFREDKSNDAALVESEMPLLRSGLILAGANRRRGGDGEDGILTALEVASLDLSGTQLVVLSACETGIGVISGGEGIYGLRRALVLAGAESQVISLWKVSDSATSQMMIDYYTGLMRGEGRAAALLHVQRRMLASGANTVKSGDTLNQTPMPEDISHPYFWASFIQSGAPDALDWAARPAPKHNPFPRKKR